MTVAPEKKLRTAFPANWRGGRKGTGHVSMAAATYALAIILAAQAALSMPVQAETFGPGGYSYTVPTGVTRLAVKVAAGGGAAGSIDSPSGPGGAGGGGHVFEATLNVVPGQIISGIVGDGGHAGAQGMSAPGGIGGVGAGNGGPGGKSGERGRSGAGGGGGGGTSLALDGTIVLLAGGGGGGQGGAYQSYSAKSGGDAVGITQKGTCNASGNGVAGADFSGDGGGGGGGGGGYTGGSGGTGHADRSTGGLASGGGSSCRTSDGSVFAAGPTVSLGKRVSNSGGEGPLGYVEIIALKPSLTKAFSTASVKKGENFSLTFTLASPTGAAAQSGLAFKDTLPAGLVLAGPPAASQCGGTISGSAGSQTVSLSGGSLAAGPSSCTVTVQVTTAAEQGAAQCPNPSGNRSTTNGPGNVSGLSDNLGNAVTDQCVGVVLAPVLTKAFGASSVTKGQNVALTFTLKNPDGGAARTGLSFTDTLPGGLVLAAAPAASQCGGTASGTAGGNSISLSGGSLAAGPSSCTVTAQVTTATAQAPAQCSNASTTNGRGNITAISGNLTNGVTDQCLIVKAAVPAMTVSKVTSGGTGTFGFKGSTGNANGFPTDGSYAVTTTAEGTAASGSRVSLSAADTRTAIEETLPAGWRLTSARCEDLNWQETGNPRGAVIGSVSEGRTLVIPAANAKAGAELSCTFTNSFVGLFLYGQVIRDDGSGSGTAYNALRDGSEAGLGGVPVRFTDCATTTYASTVTAGNGSFSLPLAGPSAGDTLCVVRDAVPGLAGVSGRPGDTGGTVAAPGYDVLSFTFKAGVDYALVLFGAVAEPALAADGSATVAPGAAVFLAHKYTATTTASVSFSVANARGQPNLSAFSYTLLHDTDCSGTPGSGETAVANPVSVTAGGEVCLLVRIQASSRAPGGATIQYDVTADTALSGTEAKLGRLTDHDVVTVSGGGTITLVKQVRNVTTDSAFSVTSSGGPGDILEYRITFTNPSARPVSNVSVFDETPAYTSLVVPPGATVQITPAGMTCKLAVPSGGGANGYAGPLQWNCTGAMSPGATGRVAFRARIAD